MSYAQRCLASSALIGMLCAACSTSAPSAHREHESAARLERDVRALAGFGTRHTLSQTDDDERGIGAARRWLAAELERISAEHHGGRLRVALEAHAIPAGRRMPEGAEVVNVVATLPGRDPDRYVVVSGHYDSRNSDPMDAVGDAPGANDDASGTAVVLECARALAGLEPRATVVFLCVAGEEQGLHGSRAQAIAWRDRGVTVEAFLTNDIVGGARGSNGRLEPWRLRLFSEGVPSGGKPTVGSDNDAPSRQLARYLEEVGEAAVPGFDVDLIFRQDRYLRGGDHRPFNDLGIAAVRFTEPNENYAWQHQDVRQEQGVLYGDRPENVDFEYVARVAAVNAAGLRALALAPRPPTNVTMDTSKLTPHTTLTWDSEVEGVAGWRVRMRPTAESRWTETAHRGVLPGVVLELRSKDDWLFAVEAYDAAGHTSLPVYPSGGN